MARCSAPPRDNVSRLLGTEGPGIVKAASKADAFLRDTPKAKLLRQIGQTLDCVPCVRHINKDFFQDSYGGAKPDRRDDLLAGRGLFYVNEGRRLFLDCTAGHYQMTWGYNDPELLGVLEEATRLGVVWDDHSNLPGNPVKALSRKLVELANVDNPILKEEGPYALTASPENLNTVLLGVCTGTVACSTALKIMLERCRRERKPGPPVIVTIEGNYHGTDFLAQHLRGMWPRLFDGLFSARVEPNDYSALEAVFAKHGERIAGFMCEPILMNRECILIEKDFLKLAGDLCRANGALIAIDEIQTGFWAPRVFRSVDLGFAPDFIICGKGMTAGFHPLSAVIYKSGLDVLEMYDSISTNGNAPMASLIALQSIAMMERDLARVAKTGDDFFTKMSGLAEEFPKILMAARGDGYLAGLKFHRVADAIAFHKRCMERGLWLRVHAYHEGHSTILVKFALALDGETTEFFIDALRELLAKMRG
ncbi:MAG TPA: aminotransferase class III-fold pyridoxal phosphate-dependent enzyme [Candidatus Brocadiia bacterium]|nr:aminotransferase class III-fold pyridoxal phosphate-dependent enzyme [Candidatus Brocadiia bacterium]